MQSDTHQNTATKTCPYCASVIPLAAKKCPHCHEFLDKEAQVDSMGKRFAAWLGILAAAISVYYALREGYFYVQTQQQVRQQVASYIKVADTFSKMDLLHLAEKALKQAQAQRPNDISLQKRLFLLQVEADLRDANWSNQARLEPAEVDSLIMQGHRLEALAANKNERADLNLALARVLNLATYKLHDIQATYEKAQQHASNQADAKFYYGQWLVNEEVDEPKGLSFILEAIQTSPDDALYRYVIAQAYLDQENWQAALQHIEHGLTLPTASARIDRIRAANGAKQQLNKLVLTAAKDKHNQTWQMLGTQKQQALIEQLLGYFPTNRPLNRLAADFYASTGALLAAREAIEKVISVRDITQIQRGYYIDEFELYQTLLSELQPDSTTLQQVQRALASYYENQGVEEVLEWGLQGEQMFKIGLKVKQADNGLGLVVVSAFTGYPFANAGVQAQDIVLEVAHRAVKSLQDIGYVLRNFDKGSTTPVKVLRAGESIELTLLVD